jgi:predicted phosphodiesterase
VLTSPGVARLTGHGVPPTGSRLQDELMRYGVLSDVHGNLHALETALEFLRLQAVDGYLCAGDLVGYGPYPTACVHRVLELADVCVAGNHDLIALGRLGDDRCIRLARESLRWTREALSDDARRRLAALPLEAETRAGVFVTHGTLGDPQHYVDDPAAAREALSRLEAAGVAARVMVVGHTHRPMAFAQHGGPLPVDATGTVALPSSGRVLLNPGAVGQSRDRLVCARIMVLDLDIGTATFHALRYDDRACRRALAERGLPPGSCHLVRPPWRTSMRQVKRLFARG